MSAQLRLVLLPRKGPTSQRIALNMAVVVRNEGPNPFYFGAGSTRKALEPGVIDTVSEDEFATVPFSKRGEGQINVLWPNAVSSDTNKVKIENYAVNGAWEPHYIGTARQGSATSDPVWSVRKLTHEPAGSRSRIIEMQVIDGVAWDDRYSLDWDA